MARFSIVGATGKIGSQLVQSILRAGHACDVISRGRNPFNSAALDRLRILGAEISIADPSDVTAMTNLLRGTDVVICTIGESAVASKVEMSLLEAAVNAGVGRFIPNEFSIDTTAISAGSEPCFDAKKAFQRALLDSGIDYTGIFPGLIFDLGLPNLAFHKHVISYGEHPEYLYYTHHRADLGAITVMAALDERCRKQFVQLRYNKVSQAETLKRLLYNFPIYRFPREQMGEDALLDGEHPLLASIWVDNLGALSGRETLDAATLFPEFVARDWQQALRDPGFVFGYTENTERRSAIR